MFCNNSGSYYRYKRVFAMSKLIDKKVRGKWRSFSKYGVGKCFRLPRMKNSYKTAVSQSVSHLACQLVGAWLIFFGHRRREWQPTALDYMSGQPDLQQMDTVDSFR